MGVFPSDFRLQSFLWRVGIFSLFFLCCFYFLLKVHVNFYISTFVLSKCSSSFVHVTFRPFWNIQRATRISVYVTAVNKSHEFLLKVHQLFYFFDNDTYAFASTRHNFFPRRRKGFDFDDESMFFQRRRTLWRADLWRRRDIDFSTRIALVLNYILRSLCLSNVTLPPRSFCRIYTLTTARRSVATTSYWFSFDLQGRRARGRVGVIVSLPRVGTRGFREAGKGLRSHDKILCSDWSPPLLVEELACRHVSQDKLLFKNAALYVKSCAKTFFSVKVMGN